MSERPLAISSTGGHTKGDRVVTSSGQNHWWEDEMGTVVNVFRLGALGVHVAVRYDRDDLHRFVGAWSIPAEHVHPAQLRLEVA